MSAPTPSSPNVPSGHKLGDGHQTLFTFSLNTTLAIWEMKVTPPGLDGGDANDTTTMHNTRYRTKAPRSLITMTDSTLTCQWDPAVYPEMEAMINRPQVVTEHFPDGSSLCYYAFVKSFMPGEMTDGAPPEATVTIVPTNQDPTTCTEQGPVYTPGGGTFHC